MRPIHVPPPGPSPTSAPRSPAVSGTAGRALALLLLGPALAAPGAWISPSPLTAQEAASLSQASSPPPLTPRLLEELTFRLPGPAVTGGRIHDVEALPDDPSTIYVATASGGLWKTTNQGTTWEPIFDDQPVSTFGDVAVAPSDPDVVWAGTGEQQNRQSTSWGNGVYRSTDGGETWTHLGLEETRHIGKVRVHPEDPGTAWVAALGNLWAPTEARGVYRTLDAGETWQKVLYVDTLTGFVDMELDPSNPDVLYAAAYQRLRRTWGFNGGGPGSGIWKTTDGGETWTELTAGLPEGDLGRIGIAVAPSDPRILYATVEHAEEGGTYRSRDAGATWEKVNDLNPRPMYYSHIHVDPADPERVYVLSTEFYMSDDGGRQFREMPTRPTYDVGVHSDHHTLWIDPGNPEHFYLAGDAGLHETFDRGETYKRINNFPIAQFYAIGVDDRDPYWIYGGLQDNHSFAGPSATRWWIGILNDDWRQTGFGDGMYQQPEPGTHRRVYVLSQNGGITRVDAETGDRLDVEPALPEEPDGAGETAAGETEEDPAAGGGPEEYRFDWVTPALVSRHDPSKVYLGGNRLFISRDRGESWRRTEDLTKRIDRDTLTLMGVAGADIQLSRNDGTASFGEITTIAESPRDADVLWVGTDDGNVQVSRDGGESWTEVGRNVPGIPATAYVSRVTASGTAPGAAWVAVDLHRRGDFAPYLFRTGDFGATWTSALGDLPASAGSVNEVIEHPRNPDLVFLGTEHGLFVSADRGAHWSRLGSNLPTTLYDDLEIQSRENALVVGTHGRALWILDDLTPLEEWSTEVAGAPAHLFAPEDATFFHYWKRTSYRGQGAYAGENPAFGAALHYHLAEPADSARIVISRADGTAVRTLEVPGEAGVIHRVHWDLRHPPPPVEEDDGDGEEQEEEPDVVESERELPVLPHPLEDLGPFVSPGTYRATLMALGSESSATFEVRADPEMPITAGEYRDREAWLLELSELQRRAFEASSRASDLRDSLEPAEEEEPDGEGRERLEAARDLARRLNRIRFRLYGLAEAYNGGGVQQGSLYPPTPTHREVRTRLERRLQSAVGELEDMAETTGEARDGG